MTVRGPPFFLMLKVRTSIRKTCQRNSGSGVALILVTFIVALATIIVVNLTYSTYLGSRSNMVVERSLFAEYLLKSTVNLAEALIKADQDPNKDGPQDEWAKFSQGVPIPPELLGLTESNLRLEVEIAPENGKFPIKGLVPAGSSTPDLRVRDMLTRLFRNLGFDNDQDEIVTSGPMKGKYFNSEQMVANLIDYMDPDNDSYSSPGYAQGIEASLPKDTFENRSPLRVAELGAVPGFTPNRMRKLETLVTTFDSSKININFAPPIVIQSLSDQIGEREVKQILDFRSSQDGPFQSGDGRVAQIINDAQVWQQLSTYIGYESRYFQVIAKADFGTKAYFLRSVVVRPNGTDDPYIYLLELF